MKETENRSRVTLEDLLKLKRTERPPAQFWAEFDAQLRRKQLAAIVDTRPWWRRMTTVRVLARVCVPLGATAALVFAIGSVRNSFLPPAQLADGLASGAGTDVARMVVAPVVAPDAGVEPPVEFARINVVAAVATAKEQVVADVVTKREVVATTQTPEAPSPSARSIAANLAAVVAAEPNLATVVEHIANPDLSTRAKHVAPAEPLAQLATPRDNRRTRLLAYSVATDPHAPENTNAVVSRDRIARRLSDDALYDSMSRLGLSGQSLSIRF